MALVACSMANDSSHGRMAAMEPYRMAKLTDNGACSRKGNQCLGIKGGVSNPIGVVAGHGKATTVYGLRKA